MSTRSRRLFFVVAACCLLGLMVSTAGAVSVSTNDGMTLNLNSDGSWNSLTVDGNTVPQLAGVTGGFVLYMTDGIIIPWQRNTFYTGTPVRGSATQNGSNINFTGSANGINFSITLTGGLPYIKVDGTATGNGTDHSFILYFRIPVDANGWKWWDHVNASRTITNGSGNWYFVNSHFHQARHPDLSDNPFGAIDRTSSPAMGLSLSPVFYPPQAYAIQYNSQGGFWIEIEMGVTSRTSRHPNSASFSFVMYKHDPNWGDRSAVARYYSFFPQWFTKISPGGNWLVNYGNFPPNPGDFSIRYLETNDFATSWTDSNGIYDCKYNEAWCYHWGSLDTNYLEQRAQDNSNNWGRECIGKGQSYAEAAQSIILSGMRNYNGSYVGPDDPARWEDGDWGCGVTWRYITDPDPDIPNWRGFTLNGGAARNRGQSDKYWEWYSSWGRFPNPGERFTGLYHDSTAGGWAGWGSVHDFQANHWGTYDYSPVPCGDGAQGAPGAVSMWSTFHFVKFAKWAHDQMATENRPVMGNGGPSYEMYVLAPWQDFFGVGEYYDGNIQNLSISRMLANQRGCSYLYGGQSQSTILQTLLMDVYPGMGGGENYESYRSMYRWLMPIFDALDQAGWQPVTAARTSNQNFYLERYGPDSSGIIYIAAQPTTTGSTVITVNSSELGWPTSPSVTVTEMVYGGTVTRGYDGSGNLTITTPSIPANETRVYKIVPNWSVGTQVTVYPDQWEAYVNAPSTITSGSLTSVRADDSTYMVVASDPTSHKFSSHYTWHSGYSPSNVTRITFTFKGKNSTGDTPSYMSWVKQENNGTWTSIRDGGTWGTDDGTLTWTTTNTAAYMSPSGVMELNFCGCPQNSNNYSFSANWVKVDMWVLNTAPTANFVGSPTTGARPLTVQFTDQSTGVPTSWSWNFGDSSTSTAQSPSHVYSTAGSYTVALTATNAYGNNTNTKSNYITVTNPAPPVADFSGTPTNGMEPLSVAFTDLSTNSPTSWSWTFGDGGTSTSRNPGHTYTNAGSYTVALTATNAGGNNTRTKSNYINVTTQAPIANFTANTTNGQVPMAVNFTDTSTNAPTSWSWTFGDGNISTAQNPSHTYTTAGDYTVALTATNSGGYDTKTVTNYITVANTGEVIVYPDTVTTFPNPAVTLISGVLADLKTDDGIYQVWRNDTSNHHYEVMYTADTIYTPAQVSRITVEYQAKSSRSDTPSSGNVFIRQSNGSWPFIANWVPGSSDTDYTWNTTAASTYMDSNGVIGFELCACPGSNSNNYDISSDKLRFRLQLAVPVANFTATPTSGLKTLAVSFTDTSTNSPTSWSWTFGDGGTSTSRNPSHSYTTQGLYTVALTATNAAGSNTMTKSNYIRVFREVSVYPTSWNTYTNAPSTLIAGGLSNLQADDSSYMQIRCDSATKKYSAHYVWATSYTPAHVGNILLDYNGKNSRSDTPSFLSWIKKQSDGTWTQYYSGLWTTTDKTISWSSTDTSYLSSGGQMEINFCGCPTGGNNNSYDQYADLVRIRLWLDN